MKPRVIRMSLAVDYINEYLMQKGIGFNEIADVCDRLISMEVCDKPINEEELNKLAEKSLKEQIQIAKHYESLGQCYGFSYESGFKEGYRKAKEQL